MISSSISRRAVLAAGVNLTVLRNVPASAAADDGLWQTFRARFITPEGRVVDDGNGNVSHSEGQGWGLLFAVLFDDQPTFELILSWTERILQRPHDALHAWRYVPEQRPAVGDLNNATDGDIFIAAALTRAAARWGAVDYAKAAVSITRDILSLLTRDIGGQIVLLPAAKGFERPDGVVINPSYYAAPFLNDLARLVPSRRWSRLQQDGKSFLARGRFGKWSLPPDWLLVSHSGQSLAPAPGWPPRFSYDAIRVPLWLAWAKAEPGEYFASFVSYWTGQPDGVVPAWADLVSNTVSPYPASAGILAVARLVQAVLTATVPELPDLQAAPHYYDAALIMLSHLAGRSLRAA